MAVVLEVAQQEVKNWLDLKKVKSSQRDQQKDAIDILSEAVSDGTLTIAEDGTITHKLNFPLETKEGEIALSELTYKPRLNDQMLKPYLVGVKATDSDARLISYMGALTQQNKGLLEKLDTADKRISVSITIFFF